MDNIIKYDGDNKYSYTYLKNLVDLALEKVSLEGVWNNIPSKDGVTLAIQANEIMNNLERAYNQVSVCPNNYRSSHYATNRGSNQSGNNGNNSVCSGSNYSVVRNYNS